jgi:hypothetical protein
MQKRNATFSTLAVAALVAAGACTDVGPVEPMAAVPTDISAFFGKPDYSKVDVRGGDAELVAMAAAVPGFAGYHFDDNMNLVISMAPSLQTMSTSVALQALRGGIEARGVSDSQVRGARVRQVTYDFAQLSEMHGRVRPVFSLAGVVFTDADEKANRVRIGVENDAAEAAVARAIGMLGIPREAVIISRAEPVQYMQGLRDRVRPVAGGLQINFPGFLCTLGLNVRSPAAPGVHGFLTNSHCTNAQWDGAAGNTPYWQPTGSIPGPSDPNWIGTEVHDAPFFTNLQNPFCPLGRRCRYSDAAGARYGEGIPNAFARIYRTTGFNELAIDQANPFHNIVAEHPTNTAVGDSVYKVGRTTGFTRGVVTSSCVSFNIGPTDHYLCHDWVTGPANSVGGGDSGSSTWTPAPLGQMANVRVNGLLCCGAGTTIFIHSPMSGIRMDNPPPSPATPWRIFPPPPAP